MTRREQLQENVEDAVFALLMEDVAEQEGKRLIEENEQLKHDPSAKVPDDLDKRCRKIIKRSYAKDRRRTVGRTIHNILGNVALAAMVCIMLFVSVFAAVPEIRVMTLNLLIEISDVSTVFDLSGCTMGPPLKMLGPMEPIAYKHCGDIVCRKYRMDMKWYSKTVLTGPPLYGTAEQMGVL